MPGDGVLSDDALDEERPLEAPPLEPESAAFLWFCMWEVRAAAVL